MIKYITKCVLCSCAILFAMTNSALADDFSESELKSLFTQPEQRNRIDAQRMGRVVGSAAPSFGPNNVSINGVVKRKGGKSVVWINGKSTMEKNTIDGVHVKTRSLHKKSKIPVIVDGRTVYLQPGQTWSEETGKIRDSY